MFSFMKETENYLFIHGENKNGRESTLTVKRQIQKTINLPFTNNLFIYYSVSLYVWLIYSRTRFFFFYLKVSCFRVMLYHRLKHVLIVFLWFELHINWQCQWKFDMFMKTLINWNSQLQIDEWTESVNLHITHNFVLKLLVSQPPNIRLHYSSVTQQLESIYSISRSFIFYNTLLKWQAYLLN